MASYTKTRKRAMNHDEIYEKLVENGFLISKAGLKEALRIQAKQIFKDIDTLLDASLDANTYEELQEQINQLAFNYAELKQKHGVSE